MKRFIYVLLCLVFLFPAYGQEKGVRFFQGNWEDALIQAKQEDKKIFIDFYTTWCSPCLYMTKNILPLPEVGEVYNKHFICLKIDAEKGEGPMLKEKYGIKAYPTFVFVDPNTQKVVHRSEGARDAVDFIEDAQGALNSKLSSVYLEETYRSGNYDRAFLKDYIRSSKASGNRHAALNAFKELLEKGGKLTEPDVWQIYYDCLHPGYLIPRIERHDFLIPCIKEISDNYKQFVQLYGKEAVDTKLSEGTLYAPVSLVEPLCNFKDKDFNIKMSRMTQIFREGTFEEGWDEVDKLIADTTLDKTKFCEILYFYTYVDAKYTDHKLTFEQLVRKLKYTRYIAYNAFDREDVMPHYTYAEGLEYLIQRSIEEKKAIPADFLQVPQYGKKGYDLQSPYLTPKPKRK